MGEMAYVGSPSRGSSSFPYSRTAPSLVEEISAAQFSNSNVRGIEEDLALIRQGERAQQQPPSDEDTEDASETDQQKKEDEYTEMREQIYRDKLAYLKQQLEQLEQGLHPDYQRKLKKLETVYKDRLLLNEVWKDYEMQRAEEEYINEKQSASRELEEKKIELQENLISELEEKKRHVETERVTIELTGDSMEIKAPTTRKLRRRPNDPINVNSSTGSSDKRRKMAPAQLAYLLDENDVVDDLRAIERGASGPPPTKPSGGTGPSAIRGSNNGIQNRRSNYSSPARQSDQSPSRSPVQGQSYGYSGWNSGETQATFEARVEDGKLFYEKRWYHRGQTVQVEGKKARFAGVISAIGTEAVWVRRPADGGKVKISIWQLCRGKYTLGRKAP
ncbi:sin3 histone deacetylase corepressor complex component SDS3-like [Daphnia carinata]|uniref:sin3 histone deacetylase corepressor complex component SDS3-like n=1 Tax=Daphnia carinata TaxID=120202 RepID=UPI00257F4057|nr:sin3 histone deacetylase corepressor complex component SDS3-like [Daphnia carinata]